MHSKYRAFKMPCIYVYFFDNKPIYVGQTQRQFPDRDRQHLTGRTMFDKHYRHNKTRYLAVEYHPNLVPFLKAKGARRYWRVGPGFKPNPNEP